MMLLVRAVTLGSIMGIWVSASVSFAQQPPAMPAPAVPMIAPPTMPLNMNPAMSSASFPMNASAPAAVSGNPVADAEAKPDKKTEEKKLQSLIAKTDDSVLQQTPANFMPSFDDDISSAFYTPIQTEAMKAVLGRGRANHGPALIGGIDVGGEARSLELEDAPAAPVEIPDLEFPAYHVASIMYRSPKDWMLWINGQRVTPKRKFDGLQVVGVGTDYVKLVWHPSEWKYREQVWNTPAPASKEVLKIRSHSSTTSVNRGTRSVYAVLRPNQTWVTATPMIVEGRHPKLAVTLKPEPIKQGEEHNPFSGKLAQAYIDKIAKEGVEERKKEVKAREEAAKKQAAQTQPAPAANPATAGGPALPPMPTAPMAAIPAPTSAAPSTLNDILNAVGSGNTAPAMPPMPPIPPTR